MASAAIPWLLVAAFAFLSLLYALTELWNASKTRMPLRVLWALGFCAVALFWITVVCLVGAARVN